jgi:hypothetical protein
MRREKLEMTKEKSAKEKGWQISNRKNKQIILKLFI